MIIHLSEFTLFLNFRKYISIIYNGPLSYYYPIDLSKFHSKVKINVKMCILFLYVISSSIFNCIEYAALSFPGFYRYHCNLFLKSDDLIYSFHKKVRKSISQLCPFIFGANVLKPPFVAISNIFSSNYCCKQQTLK